MRRAIVGVVMALVALALPCSGQSSGGAETNTAEQAGRKKNHGPGKEMERGGKDIGKGVGKGTKDLAEGSAGSVTDLATGHPIGAAASLGKGAGGFGKNTAAGTSKGLARIGKGLGGETKKLGRKTDKKETKR